MNTMQPVNMSALVEHRKIMRVWLGVVLAGLVIFVGGVVAFIPRLKRA